VSITRFEPEQQLQVADDSLPAWVSLLAPAMELAQVLAPTEFVPKELRNRPEAIAAAILYGHELGIGPMQSLGSIDVVEGRPQPSAQLQRALILMAGHELWVEEASGTRVTAAGRRKGSSTVQKVTWTMQMAEQAKLAGKFNWRTYPRAMLTARATSELASVLFSDVVKGLTDVADRQALEVDQAAPETGSAAPEPGTTPMRRRQRTTPAAVEPAAEPQPQPPEPEPAQPEPAAEPPEPAEPAAAAESEPPPEPAADGITDAQLQKLNIQLRELVGGVREDKLRLLSQVLGRHIESSKDLTISDASNAIERLQRISDGMDPMPDSGAQ